MSEYVQNSERRLTLNSFVPDVSFVVSKWDFLGAKVMSARSFFDFLSLTGWET